MALGEVELKDHGFVTLFGRFAMLAQVTGSAGIAVHIGYIYICCMAKVVLVCFFIHFEPETAYILNVGRVVGDWLFVSI